MRFIAGSAADPTIRDTAALPRRLPRADARPGWVEDPIGSAITAARARSSGLAVVCGHLLDLLRVVVLRAQPSQVLTPQATGSTWLRNLMLQTGCTVAEGAPP